MTDTAWERWARLTGIGFVVLFVIAFITYGDAPGPNASAQDITSFYDGDRGRVLTAGVIISVAQVLLLWFVGAIAGALREAGKGGWAAASIGCAAAVVSVFFVIVGLAAALSFQIAGQGEDGVIQALADLQWAFIVLVAFPGAGLAAAASLGLWRARLVPGWFGWAGLATAIVFLLGGTTWASDGFWAPDGAYSAWVTPIVFMAWTFVASWLLYRAVPVAGRTPETASARPV